MITHLLHEVASADVHHYSLSVLQLSRNVHLEAVKKIY